MESSVTSNNDHTYSKTVRNYLCNHCNKRFLHSRGLHEHSEHHYGQRSHQCAKCKSSFFTSTDLFCHSVINHGLKTNYYCKLCRSYWITEDMYVEHMRTHSGENRLYNCVQCDRKYKTIGKFYVHRALHVESTVQGSCQVCFKSFVNLRILLNHKCAKQIILSEKTEGYQTLSLAVPSLKNKYRKDNYIKDNDKPKHETIRTNSRKIKNNPKVENCKINKKLSKQTKSKIQKVEAKLSGRKFQVVKQRNKVIKNSKTNTIEVSNKKTGEFGNESLVILTKSDTSLRIRHGKNASPRIIKCVECGETYPSVTLLRKHMKESTCCGKPGSFACKSCGKHYSFWGGLVSHEKIGVCGNRLPRCDVCNLIFNTKEEFRRHLKTSQMCCTYRSRPGKKYECQNCGRKFGYVKSRDEHQEKCEVFVKRVFECGTCGKVIRCESNYNRHMITHTKEKKHACEKCGERFLYREYLYRHYRMNEACGAGIDLPQLPYDPKQLMCEYCGKKGFHDQSDYKLHLRSRHPGQDKLVCPKCEVNFSCTFSLRVHKKYACLGDKVCEVCGEKGFQNKREFVKHMHFHDPQFKLDTLKEVINQYKCEKCNQSFSRPYNLERHLKHVCVYGLICHVCGFRDFQSKMQFHKHVFEHETSQSVETMFPEAIMCHLCYRTFDNTSTKDRHMKTVHKINLVT